MIRPSARLASAAVLVALSLSIFKATAQQQVPPAPAQDQPSAPAPAAASALPKPDPANFTATSPSKDVINSFLQTSWGYDDSRIWQVQAILKTPVEGVSKVVILIGDKSGKQKPSALMFFTLPDGKHIIAGDQVIPFGEHPYTEYRSRIAAERRRTLPRLRVKGPGARGVCRLRVPALQGRPSQHGQAGRRFPQGAHRLPELSVGAHSSSLNHRWRPTVCA